MIYLIKVDYKDITLLKIGYTADLSKDVRYTAYRMHNPLFELLYEIPKCNDILEKKLQKYFSEYRYKDYGSEWFVWNEEIVDYFKTHTTEDSLSDLLDDVSSYERTLSEYKNYVKNLITKILNYKISFGEITEDIAINQLSNLVNHIIYIKRIRSKERLWKYIDDVFGITKDTLNSFLYSNPTKISNVISDFELSNEFPEKIKILCESFFSTKFTEAEFNSILNLVPLMYRKYITDLGCHKIKALCYKKYLLDKEIRKRLLNKDNSGNIKPLVYSTFEVGKKYLKTDIKQVLGSIYKEAGVVMTPKASDLEKYFELKGCKVTNKDTGKRDHGYEIIKIKE